MTRRLRIAMLSVHSCPVGRLGAEDTGGMNVYVQEVAGELGKLGHVVDVYTRCHDLGHQQIMEIGENARLIHLRAGEDERIHKLAIYIHLPDFACQLEDFRRRNHLRFDIVYSHYWLSSWVGRLLQGWWDVPHMTMFHTLGAVKNAIGIGEDEPELRIETERYLARNCHRIIAATEKEKEDIVFYYGAAPETIGVVPCGVNLSLFRPVDKAVAKHELGLDNNKVILFVGRTEPLKGIDRLLEAVTYLKNGRRPKLVVVGGEGDSQFDKELREMARKLHIEDSVTFVGLVRQQELPRFYSAADVCVVPSYYESFGLVALESLACGTPVVATKVGGVGSVIRQGETGYLVADNSPRHLAEKIALLLSRPEVSVESTNSMRESVAQFGWPNIAQAIARECRDVVKNYSGKEPLN